MLLVCTVYDKDPNLLFLLTAEVMEPEKVHDMLFKGTRNTFAASKSQKKAVLALNSSKKTTPARIRKRKMKSIGQLKRLESLGYQVKVCSCRAICYRLSIHVSIGAYKLCWNLLNKLVLC